MKEKWQYIGWSALAGLFGIALASGVPLASQLIANGLSFSPLALTSSEVYQITAAVAMGSQTGADRGSLNDPIFEPPAVGKAVRADLEAMLITLYEDGREIDTYPIVSKGRSGTPWETPTGRYRILTREENHFSSIGQVWMPYSMQFFGNFFIHGWPYDQYGQPVPEGYSGGCIRLATEDAKDIYNFVTLDTVVSVYNANNGSVLPAEGYELLSVAEPAVSAGAYTVADLETGEIILAKNENQVYPIASLSKLLTALTSLEVINQYQLASVSATAIGAYGYQGGLEKGERLPLEELIFPLLLESSNDAAEVIAEHYGRDIFLKQANNKAAAIGLTHTKLDDPSGLSAGNVSTARELAKLAKHIYQSKRYIFNVTNQLERKYGEHTWRNNNHLIGAEGYLGGKNGFIDESGQTQVALFELPLSEFGKRKVVFIILKSANRERDMATLVDFVRENVIFGQPPANPTFEYL